MKKIQIWSKETKMIKIFMWAIAFLVLASCEGGTVIYVDVQHHVKTPPGYLTEQQQHDWIEAKVGRVEYLSREQMLKGSSLDTAAIVCGKLYNIGYRDMVCRQKMEYGILVVRVARHSKLQAHLHDKRTVFALQLMPLHYLGLAAPVLIDFEHGYEYYPYPRYEKRHGRRTYGRGHRDQGYVRNELHLSYP